MRIVIAAVVGVALMCPMAQAQSSAPPQSAETPKVYLPGLEVFMGTIQRQHEKLWFAARARNWPLADYQLGEMKEVMGVVQDLVPAYKNLPVKDMIDAVIVGPIAEMEQAIESKNYSLFVRSFDKITAACNSCHDGASRGFIRIRRPQRNVYSNQVFAPQK